MAPVGNGAFNCQFRPVAGIAFFNFFQQVGSTSTIIGGTWQWSFQVPPLIRTASDGVSAFNGLANPGPGIPPGPTFPAVAVQVSTSKVYRGVGVLHGVPGGSVASWSAALDIYWGDGTDRSSSTVPFTWATGDWLYCGNGPQAVDA